MSFPVYTSCEIIHQLADHAQHSHQHNLRYHAYEASFCIRRNMH